MFDKTTRRDHQSCVAMDTLRPAFQTPSNVPLDHTGRPLLRWKYRAVYSQFYYRRCDWRFCPGMAADRGRVVCAADRIPAHTGIANCVMEMWKTAAYADGKHIHSLWKRTNLSHRSANRFPTATPDQAVYTQFHNACYYEYPFLLS